MYAKVLRISNELRFLWKHLLFSMVYQYRGMIKNKSVKLTSNPAEVGSEKFCWITVIPDIHLLVAAPNPAETALTSVSI